MFMYCPMVMVPVTEVTPPELVNVAPTAVMFRPIVTPGCRFRVATFPVPCRTEMSSITSEDAFPKGPATLGEASAPRST